MNKETLSKMQRMKLYGMHHAFKAILDKPTASNIPSDKLVEHLIDSEFDDRYNRKIARLRKNARLRYKAALEDISFEQHRNIEKETLFRLAECTYIQKAENILITGSTGVGKSFLACALGYQACSMEYTTLYFSTARLLAQLKLSKADGTYLKEMRKLQRASLLILDDFGLQPIDPLNSYILLEVVEDRYNAASVILTSQVPVDRWYDLIEEKTLADAILDRVLHKAHHIELKGESMRKRKTKN